MSLKKASGLLLHPTSLPGNSGIGELGENAFQFIDFLSECGQRYWQILPLNPVTEEYGFSPYISFSAFAGNPLLISLSELVREKLLTKKDLNKLENSHPEQVDYDTVHKEKTALLEKAYSKFQKQPRGKQALERFYRKHHAWLEDFTLFMALRETASNKDWTKWDRSLVERNAQALAQSRRKLKKRIAFYAFCQFLFFRQWENLHNYARKKNIQIIGDIPIYVGFQSAEVWQNQEIFDLDPQTKQPFKVAGVPPDYFSATGQLWGNPLYRWIEQTGEFSRPVIDWWQKRFTQIFSMVDIVRVDHFRAFESYWAIPADSKTAITGKWVQGPGTLFFQQIEKALGKVPIIAEDLGMITPAVIQLREQLNFPGMKVLQFAFDGDPQNAHLPHNYNHSNFIVYTGTHDNMTLTGWFNSLSEENKNKIITYLKNNCPAPVAADFHWQMIELAAQSRADICIFPLQDLLGLGPEATMNRPGIAFGNWRWRFNSSLITDQIKKNIQKITARTQRAF